MNGREDEFAGDMYTMSLQNIFDVVAFENIVGKIRSCVAEVTNKHFYKLLFSICLLIFVV